MECLELRQCARTVQVHEWGGTFKNLVMHAHFRRFRPGLRVAVSLFGGHYWRTQVIGMACSRPIKHSCLSQVTMLYAYSWDQDVGYATVPHVNLLRGIGGPSCTLKVLLGRYD